MFFVFFIIFQRRERKKRERERESEKERDRERERERETKTELSTPYLSHHFLSMTMSSAMITEYTIILNHME